MNRGGLWQNDGQRHGRWHFLTVGVVVEVKLQREKQEGIKQVVVLFFCFSSTCSVSHLFSLYFYFF